MGLPFIENRRYMLCDLTHAIKTAAERRRGTTSPVYIYSRVLFFDKDDTHIGTLELHIALDWLARGVCYSDDVNIRDAKYCRVEL